MIKKTLYGNGSPQHSLVANVDRTMKSTQRTEKIAWTIIMFVFATIGIKVFNIAWRTNTPTSSVITTTQP